MEEPLTDELLKELLNAPDPQSFMVGRYLEPRSLSGYLQQLLDEKGLVQSKVISASGVQYTYGYQLFTGSRSNPDRDILLQLLFAMGATLQEANRALQAAGKSELYCKNRRDAIIIFCLEHQYGLMRTDQELFRFGEEPISKDV